jgi:hypothetical protein
MISPKDRERTSSQVQENIALQTDMSKRTHKDGFLVQKNKDQGLPARALVLDNMIQGQKQSLNHHQNSRLELLKG